MKKILAIALAAVFVLGMAATAMALDLSGDAADLKIKGEYRVRGISKNNTSDRNNDTPDRNNYYTQRLRLWLDFTVADDVAVKTRYSIADGQWNGAQETRWVYGCEDVTYTTTDGAEVDIEQCEAVNNFTVDHAYMTIKKFNGTFTLGLQPANWGNKFWSWGGIKERIKYTTKMGTATVGVFTQKDSEVNADQGDAAAGGADAGDVDSYSALVVASPVEGTTVGLIYVSTNNNAMATDSMVAGATPGYNDKTALDVFYRGKVGPLNLAAEYASLDADFTNSDSMGMFIAANMDVSMFNLGLAYAMAENGFTTSGYFTPTLMVGTTQATGVLNLGGTGYDAAASAVVLSAKAKISDDLSAGFNYAVATLDDNADVIGGVESELTEIDLYANYKLASNTSLFVGYAQGEPDSGVIGAKDDTMTSAAFQITTKF